MNDLKHIQHFAQYLVNRKLTLLFVMNSAVAISKTIKMFSTLKLGFIYIYIKLQTEFFLTFCEL